jgi:hypothetical protein
MTTDAILAMIFRLTLKLAKKIGIAPLSTLPSDKGKNPLIDWSAHLFTAQRTQYILITNTVTLYSMVMSGRGIVNDSQFILGALSYMKEFMFIGGDKGIFEKLLEPESHDVFFSKIVDRRVMGSMNDFVFQAKVHLIECRQSPLDVSFLLNDSPMSYLNYSRPKDEFRKLLYKDSESSCKRQWEDNVIYINALRTPTTKN